MVIGLSNRCRGNIVPRWRPLTWSLPPRIVAWHGEHVNGFPDWDHGERLLSVILLDHQRPGGLQVHDGTRDTIIVGNARAAICYWSVINMGAPKRGGAAYSSTLGCDSVMYGP